MEIPRRGLIALVAAVGLGGAGTNLFAAPAITGAYSSNYSMQTISTGANLLHVDQLAFNPADPAHIYVARVALTDAEFGTVTRFDYNVNPVTGVTTIANPLTVATLESGWGPVGVAFWQGKMIVSINKNGAGTDAVGNYTNDGRLAILTPNGDGTFGGRIDFAYGMHNAYHQIDQVRIIGNTLYVGIGTRENGGLSSSNAAYNGTIARIADLSQTNFTDANNDHVTEVNALASNYTTAGNDGMLRMYASGLRNPFGLHVTASGKVWVADNGRDDFQSDTVTPDLLYKELPAGAVGIFPPGNGGVTQPFTTLGNETAATGLVVMPFGADFGDALVGRYRDAGAEGGADYVMVDSVTGQVNVFANGFGHPIDAVIDPFGRIVLADFDAGGSQGALYLVAPEPASLGFVAIGATLLMTRRARRHRV